MRWARLLILAATGLVLWPHAAHAGTYDVYACNTAIGGAPNNSFVAVTSPGMAAYAECPAGQGIVARTGWDGGTSTFLEGGFMVFDAPVGNLVESISFEMGIERHHCSWSVGVIASGYDLGGTRVYGVTPGVDCDVGYTPGPTNFLAYRWNFPVNTPRVRIESRCGAATCPRNGIAAMRLRNVVVRVRDDNAPSLTGGRGQAWTSKAWLGGPQSIGFDAADAAGVRRAAVLVDGQEVAGRLFDCDPTRRAPCPDGGFDATVAAATWGRDGEHTVTLDAIDAAGNRSSVQRTVRIDNTAPDPPRGLVVDGGDGWQSQNAFTVRWDNPAQNASPIVAAEYELCPVGPGACRRGERVGDAPTAITDLAMPGPGEYDLRVWLRDAAGNVDSRLSAGPVRLRHDDSSPEVAFVPLSAEDPTRLVARTRDRGSGVVEGQIEIRRQAAGVWTPLATVVEADQLVARLDDEYLGDGVFELRARAVDHAGNERSADRRIDGAAATITLPLRLKTQLRAGVVRRAGGRVRLARTARVRYGTLVRVSGRLTSPEGNPLEGLDVQAFTQVRDGSAPPRLIATDRTSRTGHFAFLVRRGPSRTIRIRYAGAPQIRSATQTLVVNVRSRTSMTASRRSIVTGESVTFAGKLATGRVPGAGKLVELQVRTRGRWRTFATTRTGPRGRWRYGYRFDGTSGRVTYAFRARVPRETGYPFVTGGSRVVRVKVRGL